MTILVNGAGGGTSSMEVTVDAGTGWAQYNDTVYTSIAPLVITQGSVVTLPNNAGTILNDQIPSGVTSFYSGTHITPALAGDYYIITVRFKAKNRNTTGYFNFYIDLCGDVGLQFKETQVFTRGAGVEQDFAIIIPAYTYPTFVANGGLVKFDAVDGNSSVYNISYQITRTHKSK